MDIEWIEWMKFSDHKEKNFSIKTIVTKDQFMPVFNLPLMLLAIVFVTVAVSIAFVPHYFFKNVATMENGGLIMVSVMAMAFCVIAIGQMKKRGIVNKWLKVSAVCHGGGVSASYRGIRKTWELKILCTYEINSENVELTPAPADMSWLMRRTAQAFLDSRVDVNGRCDLLINPEDYLDAYLAPLDNRMFVLLACFALVATLIGWVFLQLF